MDTQEQLVVQQCLLNSQMTFSTPEQAGIVSEVQRIKAERPELSITEITNSQIDKIKEVRGLKDDAKAKIRGQLTHLSQKAKQLSEDSVGNSAELKATLRQIDNLEKQL